MKEGTLYQIWLKGEWDKRIKIESVPPEIKQLAGSADIHYAGVKKYSNKTLQSVRRALQFKRQGQRAEEEREKEIARKALFRAQRFVDLTEKDLENLLDATDQMSQQGLSNIVSLQKKRNISFLLMGICVFGLVGILGWFLASWGLVKPLEELTRWVRLLGEGNLKKRIPIKAHDEIGELALSFNKMVEDLSQTTVSKEKLERSNKELEQFAYFASHDLQEPLRKVISFSDRLKAHSASSLDENGEMYLSRMQAAAYQMKKLIEDLLQFSRADRSTDSFEPVDLNKIIHGIIEEEQDRMKEQKATIDVASLPSIRGNETQLRQLFQNLILNALKYVEPRKPPRIKIISTLKPNEGVEIQVKDNGIGFEEKYKEKIFEPFRRLHARSEYEGNGVGLAICKKVVEHHGGSLTVESEVGKGSCFFVRFPNETVIPEDQKEDRVDIRRAA